ncbi:MAG TPA: DUF4198 domain-containing protein [Chitinophagaceae bacterium]
MKKKILFLLLLFIVINVAGHEFWIQPDKFIYKRTDAINVKFLVGENFKGENWVGDKTDVKDLQLYFDDAVDRDLENNLGTDKGDSLQLAMIDDGTAMITVNTKDSLVNVDAKKFNESLEANGLIEALSLREKNGDTTNDVAEYSQFCTKTIFQVGERVTNVSGKKTNLPLDIIPEDHPYSVAKDENFRVQIFFDGKELKNAAVKVFHKVDNSVTQEEYTTNQDGEIKFFLSPAGEWMVSCIKMVKIENDPKAQWRTYRGSLTWGYY